ncbi:MAG: chemotaxis-specific protein-glutamate methyltransferase CheB [Methylomonas sp.]|jgi:two-component system chemotaxis response regulator CheB|uniref:chemotaxis-specific protein-glutamate methyltransferase CheB n=1 Tax=Methylomonas sp. TaxID=418 RepID=UPI0025D30EEB|nr:chemotaxis-specific protein-glutamate methyltransferase CheB [Methylomonas sp.]MCK9607482.1 chemotaxis-specific protein-glutamate methyltransferase CheB [Methylomonas sp.]
MTNRPSNQENRPPIRLLVVEDSPTVREFLVYLFASDQEIQVIGTASNGEEALAAVRQQQPDVITMDVNMPKMDGYAATRAIMELFPTPIVIVTDTALTDGISTTLAALDAGALAAVKKPAGIGHPDHASTTRELVQTVKLMAEIKVVRRWTRHGAQAKTVNEVILTAMPPCVVSLPHDIRLVAIGTSTGGPLVLQQIFSALPRDLSVPVIVVQHIAQGFTDGLVEWLSESTGFPIRAAASGEAMLPGRAYIVPTGYQAAVNSSGRIALIANNAENGHCPSVSYLFRSVAAAYGARAIGILLTGMGKDGAVELGLMKTQGAITIAQDKESSVVHGMPGEAISLGAASYVLAPDKIAAVLANLAMHK